MNKFEVEYAVRLVKDAFANPTDSEELPQVQFLLATLLNNDELYLYYTEPFIDTDEQGQEVEAVLVSPVEYPDLAVEDAYEWLVSDVLTEPTVAHAIDLGNNHTSARLFVQFFNLLKITPEIYEDCILYLELDDAAEQRLEFLNVLFSSLSYYNNYDKFPPVTITSNPIVNLWKEMLTDNLPVQLK